MLGRCAKFVATEDAAEVGHLERPVLANDQVNISKFRMVIALQRLKFLNQRWGAF
jgi:hypothetical protein